MSAQRSDSERVPALDGLRGLAILLVLFFHATLVEAESAAGAVLHGLARNFGWSGVDLFFVLSGFLITGLLYDARGGRHYFRNFYARRTLRIFPVYYGFLLLFFLVGPRLDPGLRGAAGGDAVFYWVYLQNFATAAAGDWVHSKYLDLFWSLAIEEQFYLVWPCVVLACSRRALVRVCIALVAVACALRVAAVAAGVAPVAIYVLTPTRVDTLAVGALVAMAVRGERGLAPWVKPARWVGSAALLGVLGLSFAQGGFDYRLRGTAVAGYPLVAAGFGALLVLALAAPRESVAGRFFASRVLRGFGRISYALYVVHQPVIAVAASWLATAIAPRLGPSALVAQLLLWALAIGGSALVAAASWRFYETPLLRMKRRFPTVREP